MYVLIRLLDKVIPKRGKEKGRGALGGRKEQGVSLLGVQGCCNTLEKGKGGDRPI